MLISMLLSIALEEGEISSSACVGVVYTEIPRPSIDDTEPEISAELVVKIFSKAAIY